jgi:hypothetical protein
MMERAASSGVTMQVALDDGSIHDLATFTDLFPSGGAFRITRGAAHLSANANLAVEAGKARVRVRGQDVGLELMGSPLQADLDLVLAAGSHDPRSRWFDIEQGTLDLRSVTWAGKGGADGNWSARLELRGGRVRLTRPVEVIADVELELTDTRPDRASAGGGAEIDPLAPRSARHQAGVGSGASAARRQIPAPARRRDRRQGAHGPGSDGCPSTDSRADAGRAPSPLLRRARSCLVVGDSVIGPSRAHVEGVEKRVLARVVACRARAPVGFFETGGRRHDRS